jgi:hypothetical protein
VTVMAGKASNLHDYFPCNPGGGSVSGRDCQASVVRALGSHCRHCNRQLEHDRAVVEPLDNPSRIEPTMKQRPSSANTVEAAGKSFPHRLSLGPLHRESFNNRYHCGFAQ